MNTLKEQNSYSRNKINGKFSRLVAKCKLDLSGKVELFTWYYESKIQDNSGFILKNNN